MSRRKLNYNRPKVENPNRKVVLWAGQPSPFTIVPSNFNTKAELAQNSLEKSKVKPKKKKKPKIMVVKKTNVFFKSLTVRKQNISN